MRTNSLLLCVTTMLVASFCSPDAAKAYDGFGYGHGIGYGFLYNSLHYRVPHFAAHPPVYYSYPVPRTYGYSPFAYPPYVLTPDFAGPVVPMEISNPYVPKQEESRTESNAADETVSRPADEAVEPLVIHNPYVMEQDSFVRADR